jgi:hypothetical protein
MCKLYEEKRVRINNYMKRKFIYLLDDIVEPKVTVSPNPIGGNNNTTKNDMII